MKSTGLRIAVWLLAVAMLGGCMKEYKSSITIKDDGKVECVMDLTVERQQIEMMLAQREQFQNSDDDGDDDDDDADATDSEKTEKKEDSKEDKKEEKKEESAEEKLARKLKASFEKETRNAPGGIKPKVRDVKVEKDSVHIQLEVKFDSLKDFASHGSESMQFLGCSRMLMEDDEGKLKLSLFPHGGRNAAQMVQSMRTQMGQQKMKLSFKFNFPGKVTESGFPEKKDNTTSIKLDTEKSESIDAYIKTISKPIVIIAEAGKLSLEDLPLDSQKLARNRFQPEAQIGDGLEVTEAKAPYTAQGMSIKTQVVHTFKEGTAILNEAGGMMDYNTDSCTIRGRLTMTGEGILHHLERVNVIKAVDDQDREVSKIAEDEMSHSPRFSNNFRDDRDNKTAEFSIELGLPASDAEAIEELDAEAIVVVFDSWKSKEIEDISGSVDKEIDLADVLAGTKITIKKHDPGKDNNNNGNVRSLNGSIQIELTGPAELTSLDISVQADGVDSINSYPGSRQDKKDGETTVRTMTIRYHCWKHSEGEIGPLRLRVRYPDGVRKEKAKIKLEALDLY